MTQFLFPVSILDGTQNAELKGQNELKRNKNDIYGSIFCETACFSGKYDMPKMEAYFGPIPEKYITFSECGPASDANACMTFFDDDPLLEKLWYDPIRQFRRLDRFNTFCSPDYSLKIGQPRASQIANCYRNHAVGCYLQNSGRSVIPTMVWSDAASYDYCFDGYSKGGVVIVSTIGTIRDERAQYYFYNGFNEMLNRIKPDAVILYGDVNNELLAKMPGQLDVHFAEHNRFKRMRNYGKQGSI